MLSQHQLHWGVDQWAAFLSAQQLPCMPRSKMLLAALEQIQGERLAVRELADIAGGDPLLCLRLLREAEAHRTRRLGHETTTTLAAVMQLGSDTFRELLVSSPETDETNPKSPLLAFGNTQFDLANQFVLIGSERQPLTFREAKLLHYLVKNRNQVLSRDAILAAVWGDEGIIVGRSLDVFVSRLRKILQKDPTIKIVNVHSVGYRLEV